MAILSTSRPTLADVAKRTDPDGNIGDIVEILNETNEVLTDMAWKEGNLPTGHRSIIRTGLPEGTWRKLNYGVQPEKSTTVQVQDTCGMLEAYAEIDKSLADLNGNTAAYRLSEDSAFIEGISQNMARTLFYGDSTVNPERFTGLAPRFSSLIAPNGKNIIDAGGTGADNTSAWLIVWGDQTAFGIYPKGSKAGLKQEDLGEQTLFDAEGGRFQGYRSHYKWDCGLTVRDWRYIARVANIDANDLQSRSGTQEGQELIYQLITAKARIKNLKSGRAALYVNREVREALDKMALDKSQNVLSIKEAVGQFDTYFLGIPIRTVDVLLNTEARVV
jgi:hypothetical protein